MFWGGFLLGAIVGAICAWFAALGLLSIMAGYAEKHGSRWP